MGPGRGGRGRGALTSRRGSAVLRRARWGPGLLLLAGCGPGPADTLVVRVPGDDPVHAVAARAFRDAHPGAAVRFEIGPPPGAPEAGAADVWWGGELHELAGAAAAGLLTPWRPSWADAVPGWARDPEGRWHATELLPLVIAFNPDSVGRALVPGDWGGLLHFRWDGQLLVPDPALSAAGRALVGAAFVRERAGGRSDETGLRWLRGLDDRVAAYLADDALVPALARGRGWLALAPLGAVLRAEAEGLPVGHRVPAEGVPPAARGIAVLAGTPRQALARAFVEAVGSGPVQRALAGDLARTPARADLGGAGGAALPVLAASPDTLAARLDGWLERWRVEARGRGGVPR